MSLLVRGAHQVVTPTGSAARRGPELAALHILPGAVVRCDGPRISFVGDEAERLPVSELSGAAPAAAQVREHPLQLLR